MPSRCHPECRSLEGTAGERAWSASVTRCRSTERTGGLRVAFARLKPLARTPAGRRPPPAESPRDGRVVVFVSWANNLLTEDVNGVEDVFARMRIRRWKP